MLDGWGKLNHANSSGRTVVSDLQTEESGKKRAVPLLRQLRFQGSERQAERVRRKRDGGGRWFAELSKNKLYGLHPTGIVSRLACALLHALVGMS